MPTVSRDRDVFKYLILRTSTGLQFLNTKEFDLNGEPLKQLEKNGDWNGITGEVLRPSGNPNSWLGTPVWSSLTLRTSDNTASFYFDCVLLIVSQTKNIVTTAVTGRNGTFKEYISDGDYNVTIRAIVAGRGEYYPESDVQDLIDVLKKGESLIAVSDYLRMFGIHNLVVQGYNLPQNEQFMNVQNVEITALSDEPIELIIED